MEDGQRWRVAEDQVGPDAALRMVFAVDDTCDLLARLATDPSGPAVISKVIELVLETEDF
jgi:hypothetical protein